MHLAIIETVIAMCSPNIGLVGSARVSLNRTFRQYLNLMDWRPWCFVTYCVLLACMWAVLHLRCFDALVALQLCCRASWQLSDSGCLARDIFCDAFLPTCSLWVHGFDHIRHPANSCRANVRVRANNFPQHASPPAVGMSSRTVTCHVSPSTSGPCSCCSCIHAPACGSCIRFPIVPAPTPVLYKIHTDFGRVPGVTATKRQTHLTLVAWAVPYQLPSGLRTAGKSL